MIKNGGSTVVPKNQPLESDWAKKLTKKDMMLFFFSSESWHVAFFNSDVGWTLGWTPGRQFYFEILRFYDFWRNWHVISKLNRRPDVHPSVHPTSELKKATCQLSLEKKINLVSFFVKILAQSHSRPWFFRNHRFLWK